MTSHDVDRLLVNIMMVLAHIFLLALVGEYWMQAVLRGEENFVNYFFALFGGPIALCFTWAWVLFTRHHCLSQHIPWTITRMETFLISLFALIFFTLTLLAVLTIGGWYD